MTLTKNPHFGRFERIRLQALPLEKLIAEAHVLSDSKPAVFPTPHHAWTHLRAIIAPDVWDVKHDVDPDGDTVYVAWFGGEVLTYAPMTAPDACDRLCAVLANHFEKLYPRHLVDLFAGYVALTDGGAS